MKILLIAAAATQLVLGLWRARLLESSVMPALALTGLFALVALIRPVTSLARLGALLAATAGVLSAMSAFNAPLIGNVARISVPLFAFAVAFILYAADIEHLRIRQAAAIVFVIAVAVLEYDLTRDALWEANSQERSWITKS